MNYLQPSKLYSVQIVPGPMNVIKVDVADQTLIPEIEAMPYWTVAGAKINEGAPVKRYMVRDIYEGQVSQIRDFVDNWLAERTKDVPLDGAIWKME